MTVEHPSIVNPSQHARLAREDKRRQAEALRIDDSFIARMVDAFYAKVREDPVLGPIFAAHVVDWTPHFTQMNRFWRSVLFSSGEFAGNPVAKHAVIPDLNRAEFACWLALFDATWARSDRRPRGLISTGARA